MAIDEIHTLSQNDASISQLVEAVQAQMGKVLTRSEIETLVSFYTYAGLPPEYILLARRPLLRQKHAEHARSLQAAYRYDVRKHLHL